MSKFEFLKFKIFLGFEVLKVLEFMGLILLFGREVDLIEMLDFFVFDKFYVFNIYYKIFVEVNEKGIEVVVVIVLIVIVKSL